MQDQVIKRPRAKRSGPRQGKVIVWPRGAQLRYDVSPPTLWRWERDGKLPPRDVFIGGKAVGWRPATLDRADSGLAAR